MELVIFVFLIGVTVSYWYSESTARKYESVFRLTADHLGLKLTPRSLFRLPVLRGEIAGRQIVVRESEENKGCIEVSSTGILDIPGEFNITKETGITKMQRAIGIKDIETGDKVFDRTLLLSATYPQVLLSLLDEETRGMILSLNGRAQAIEITNHRVLARIMALGRKFLSYRFLDELIELTGDIGKNLSAKTGVRERLVKNIRYDSLPGVRLQSIRALTSHFPMDDEIAGLLRETLSHRDLELQVEAARHLGAEGMPHLTGVLETRNALLDEELLIVIVNILGRNRYSESIPVLQKVYLAGKSYFVKKAVLEAFSEIRHEGAGSFLLAELDKKDQDLELFIVKALGFCGRVEAVEKLYQLGKSSYNISVRRAVKDAISHIQLRLGDVEKGWLSVTDLQELDGALSEVESGKND